jgi:hypothetical protein
LFIGRRKSLAGTLQSQVVLEAVVFWIKAAVGMEFVSDVQFLTLSIMGSQFGLRFREVVEI